MLTSPRFKTCYSERHCSLISSRQENQRKLSQNCTKLQIRSHCSKEISVKLCRRHLIPLFWESIKIVSLCFSGIQINNQKLYPSVLGINQKLYPSVLGFYQIRSLCFRVVKKDQRKLNQNCITLSRKLSEFQDKRRISYTKLHFRSTSNESKLQQMG